MSIFENFDKNEIALYQNGINKNDNQDENENSENKELNTKLANIQKTKNNSEISYYKNIETITPNFNLFEDRFIKENETINKCAYNENNKYNEGNGNSEKNDGAFDEDFNFIYKRKKHMQYIDISRIADNGYVMPDGNCIGYTFLEKRKISLKTIFKYLKYKERYYSVYEHLNGIPIGAIPINDGDYIIAMKRTDYYMTPLIIVIGLIVSFITFFPG